jgi:uncharacterized protein YciI
MHVSTILRIIGVCVTIPAAVAVITVQTHAQVKPMPELRYVVVHKPGPSWKTGVSAFEQVGLSAHVDHFRKLLNAGKLTMGGPFMDGTSGGMMIAEPSVSEAEITKFASEDPTVQSGLLIFEVRPWLPALRK